MNARLYDPLIGRFIQADTMIPDAGTAQDYNRYAYVRNNPMKYSDPSGHFPFLLGLGLFLFSMTTDDPFLQKVTGLAGNIIMGGALSSLGYTAIQNGAILSFIGGTAQGGLKEGLKQGVIGGVTAGLTKGLADKIGHGYKPGPVLGQMVLHGAIAELRGGKFKHGAISALAGKMGSHYGAKYFGPIGTGTEGDRFGRAAVSAMFGGLAAEASGGSFEDGAMQALFVHLFNDSEDKAKLIHANKEKTGDRTSQFNEAYYRAKKAINMLLMVDKDKAEKARYEKYFGKYSKANYVKVLQAYREAVMLMKTGVTLRYSKHFPGVFGQVIMGDRRSIYYGPDSYKDPKPAETLLHEMMHLGANQYFDDAYGHSAVFALALKSPLGAIRNADSYTYYPYDK